MSEPGDLSPVQRAEELFRQGYNCAQAVVFSCADRRGGDTNAALRMASGLGGGIGHRQETCGAVTGAVLVLGLLHGRALGEPKDRTDATYARAEEFMRRFEARHGTCVCRDLLGGCDFNTAAGECEFKERGYRETRCAVFIRDAVRILGDLEQEAPAAPAGAGRVNASPGS